MIEQEYRYEIIKNHYHPKHKMVYVIVWIRDAWKDEPGHVEPWRSVCEGACKLPPGATPNSVDVAPYKEHCPIKLILKET